jgi:hypothetical protein
MNREAAAEVREVFRRHDEATLREAYRLLDPSCSPPELERARKKAAAKRLRAWKRKRGGRS